MCCTICTVPWCSVTGHVIELECINWLLNSPTPCNRGHMRKWRIEHVPLRMVSRGAIALWCQTVMSRVHGNTINTMARMSLLFGISRIGFMSLHYLPGERRSDKHQQQRPLAKLSSLNFISKWQDVVGWLREPLTFSTRGRWQSFSTAI